MNKPFVLIRSNISGVWAGQLESQNGKSRTLTNARRVWSWSGRLSCSELANEGPGTGSRISAPVLRLTLDRSPGDEMIEIQETAIKSFLDFPAAKPNGST